MLEDDSKPTVHAGGHWYHRHKSLPGMNCPEKIGLSRNSATVHWGMGGVRLDSLKAAECQYRVAPNCGLKKRDQTNGLWSIGFTALL